MVPDVVRLGTEIGWSSAVERQRSSVERLVGLRAWPRSENARRRNTERHLPGLNHARPGDWARLTGLPGRRSRAGRSTTTTPASAATVIVVAVVQRAIAVARTASRTGSPGVPIARGGSHRPRPSVRGTAGARSAGSKACAGHECVLGNRLRVLHIVLFLQQQIGAHREEGVRRLLGSDDRNSMAVLGGEAAKHVQDLGRLAHRLADIPKNVGELLQFAGVGCDVNVALDEGADRGTCTIARTSFEIVL